MLCRAHGYNHLITVTSRTHEELGHGPSLLSLPIGRIISIAVVLNALATRQRVTSHVTGTTDIWANSYDESRLYVTLIW
jgi:hypothetical protein